MTSIAAKAKAAATMTEAFTTLLNTSGGAFLTFSLSLLSMGGMFGADWCLNGWSAIAWDSGFVGREHGSASVGTILKQSNKIIIHFNKLKNEAGKVLVLRNFDMRLGIIKIICNATNIHESPVCYLDDISVHQASFSTDAKIIDSSISFPEWPDPNLVVEIMSLS